MDSNFYHVAHKGFMIDIVDREWAMDVLPNDDVMIVSASMEQSRKNPIQNTLSQLTNNHPSLAVHPLFLEEGGAGIADLKDNSLLLGENGLVSGLERLPNDFGKMNEWNDLNLYSLIREDSDDI
ncbi:hypothetical protein C9374_002049 [Naegleria lovaniensis]|uniref:Anaphase-promoting complex subunit 13 n=1 Tax=Naegleria lovaniensis TaxID=51637 RepID=A0AA88GVM9_NAELO|nr:uncharacterized protein C9374_002049 [Naegleria lovaniensis]KAG2387014.1 hypothetical protein C9374_002049 [Naegleria lovaniensis]